MPYQNNWRGIVDSTNALVVAAGGTSSANQPASMAGLINRLYAYNRALGSSTFINQKPDAWETAIKIVRDCIVFSGGSFGFVPDNQEGFIKGLSTLLVTIGGSVTTSYPDSFNSMVLLLQSLTTAATPNLLLDVYPGAVVAYSLRKIKKTYSGNCIRVRRSTDSTETNIGFTGNDLDQTSLTAFDSLPNLFIRTWYDQTSTTDAGQSTAGSQPGIKVTATKPQILFPSGGQKFLSFSNTMTPATFLVVLSFSNTASYQGIFSSRTTPNSNVIPASSSNILVDTFDVTTALTSNTATAAQINGAVQTLVNFDSYGSGVPTGGIGLSTVACLMSTHSISNGSFNMGIGVDVFDIARSLRGTISEFVIWPTQFTSGQMQTVYNSYVKSYWNLP
jgi:hypothetical protein